MNKKQLLLLSLILPCVVLGSDQEKSGDKKKEELIRRLTRSEEIPRRERSRSALTDSLIAAGITVAADMTAEQQHQALQAHQAQP